MKQTLTATPKLSTQLLHWALPDELKEPVMGDLEEEYLQLSNSNPALAQRWYRRQALRSAWQFIRKTKRGFIMLLVSIAIFVGFTIMGMMMSGGVTMFIDVPSLMITLPATVAFTIAATSWPRCKQAIAHFVSQSEDFAAEDLIISKQVFSMFGNINLWVGAAMTLLGWVAIGSNLDDPSSFGPAFAVSVLTLLYAMLIKIVCYVAEQKLQYKLNLAE